MWNDAYKIFLFVKTEKGILLYSCYRDGGGGGGEGYSAKKKM